MEEFNKKNVSKLRPSFFYVISLFFIISVINGCASSEVSKKKITDKEIEIKVLEKRIALLEEKMNKAYSRLSVVQFTIENHENILRSKDGKKTSSKKLSQDIPNSADENTDKTPEEIYAEAMNCLKSKQYEKALEYFNFFLENYPEHKFSDNAMYWKGETFYTQKKYFDSAKIFMEVSQKYPDGAKHPDALLKAGYSYVHLGENEKAKKILQKIIRNFPFSSSAPKAEKKLKQLL